MPVSRRARTFLTAFAVTAVVAIVLAAPGIAQRDPAALGDDPRNRAYFDEGYCYGHHYPKISPDWVNPSAEAIAPPFAVAGVPFNVTLRVDKNWEYDLRESLAVLNITGAPGVRFVGENRTAESVSVEGDVARGGERGGTAQDIVEGRARAFLATPVNPTTLTFVLTPNAASTGSPLDATPGGVDLDLALKHPDGAWFWANTTGGGGESVEIPHDLAAAAAGRPWNATITYRGGLEPIVHFTLEAHATFDAAADTFNAQVVPGLLGTDPGNVTVTWTLVADEPGDVVLDFRAKIFAYHTHTPQDEGHTTDDGNITRYDRVTLQVYSEAPDVEVQKKGFALPAPALVAAVGAVAGAAILRRRRRA